MPETMSEELGTKERLARLRMAFPSDEALSRQLSCQTKTIRKVARADGSVSDRYDLATKIERLHEQIQKEHQAGLDAVSYALQTIQRLREGTLTDEHLDNVESVLQQKADDLQTAYA